MGLNSPWAKSIDIIALQLVKKWLVIKSMGLSVFCANSIDIITFQTAEINLQGLTQWELLPLGPTLLWLLTGRQ